MAFEYVFNRVGTISSKWFGSTDFASINYSIYLMSAILPLKLKYLKDQKILYKIYPGVKVFGACILASALVSLVYDGYLLRKDIKRLTYSLTSSVLFIGSLLRITLLMVRQDEVEDCLDQLNNNFYIETIGKDERDMVFIKNGERVLKNLFKIFYAFFVVSLIARMVCHLLPQEKMLMLPFPFVDEMTSPSFEILFILQTLGLSHFALIVMTHELIIFSCMIRILVHFKILSKNLSEIAKLYPEHEYYDTSSSEEKSVKSEVLLNKNNCPEIVKYRLMIGDSYPEKSWNHDSFINWREEKCFRIMKEGIMHHQNLLKITTKIRAIFNMSLLCQIIGGGLLLVLSFVDVIWQSKRLSWKTYAQALYAFTTLCGITVSYFLGTELETQSSKAANSLYAVPWIHMRHENRKIHVIFLQALWKSPFFKGGFIKINLSSYLKFMNMNYNLVAFMLNTAKRE